MLGQRSLLTAEHCLWALVANMDRNTPAHASPPSVLGREEKAGEGLGGGVGGKADCVDDGNTH